MLCKKFFFVVFLFFSTPLSVNDQIHKITYIPSQSIKNISEDRSFSLKSRELKQKKKIDFSKMIKNIFQGNDFVHVKINKSQEKLIFSEHIKPIIEEINFSGNKCIKDKKWQRLIDNFGLKKNNFFNLLTLKKYFLFLSTEYKNKGYFNAHATLLINPIANNKVQLKIILVEDVEFSISKVCIHGNNHFSEKKILSYASEYNTSILWNFILSHKYRTSKVKILLKDIKKFYISEGFLDFRIKKVTKKFLENTNKINLDIDIYEGKKYKIKKIYINKNDISADHKASIKNITKNLPQSSSLGKDINLIKTKIKNFFISLGYPHVSVLCHSEINRKNKKILVYFWIDKKKQYMINNKSFSGNSRTRDKFLNKLIDKNKKSFFDKNEIKNVCKNLFNTGLFKSIHVSASKTSDNSNKIDIHYLLKENHDTRTINVSSVYEKERGFLINLLLLEKNLFGTGGELYMKILKNISDTNIKIYLFKPFFVFKKFFLKSDFFFNSSPVKSSSAHNYVNKVFGFCTSLYTPTIKNKNFSVSCGYENIHIAYKAPHIALLQYLLSFPKKFLLEKNVNDFFINDFFLKYLFNFHKIVEKKFSRISTDVQMAYKIVLPISDNFYHKIFFSIEHNVLLKKLYNIIVRNYLEFGSGSALGSHLFPFYENYKFYRKTSNSAFKDNSIGPTAIYFKAKNDELSVNKNKSIITNLYPSTDFLGGNMLVHANLEILSPHIEFLKPLLHFFQTGVFLDIIHIWDTQWKNSIALSTVNDAMSFNRPDYPYISIGTFVRLRSLFGPLTLTFSIPLCPLDLPNHCLTRFGFSIS